MSFFNKLEYFDCKGAHKNGDTVFFLVVVINTNALIYRNSNTLTYRNSNRLIYRNINTLTYRNWIIMKVLNSIDFFSFPTVNPYQRIMTSHLSTIHLKYIQSVVLAIAFNFQVYSVQLICCFIKKKTTSI